MCSKAPGQYAPSASAAREPVASRGVPAELTADADTPSEGGQEQVLAHSRSGPVVAFWAIFGISADSCSSIWRASWRARVGSVSIVFPPHKFPSTNMLTMFVPGRARAMA